MRVFATNDFCYYCSDGCEVCTDNTTCSKCFAGYEMTSDGKCIGNGKDGGSEGGKTTIIVVVVIALVIIIGIAVFVAFVIFMKKRQIDVMDGNFEMNNMLEINVEPNKLTFNGEEITDAK